MAGIQNMQEPGECPAESKTTEAKPTESKESESKPSESKPSESKPSESNHSESKPSEPKLIQRSGLDESPESEVHIERKGAVQDLVSATSWEELSLKPELLKGIYSKGFAKPSKIQAVALPHILKTSQHLVAQAKNGSGKTATFALAIISKINANDDHCQALCLSPTRELARQNLDVIEELAKFCGLKTFLACPPAKSVNSPVQVVSGTPGKVADLMRVSLDLSHLMLFVLDEADVMLDRQNNMGSQVLDISKLVKRNRSVQVLLFSATFPDRVVRFADHMAPDAIKLTMKKEELTLSTTDQFWMDLIGRDNAKADTLVRLYAAMSIGQSVIFVNQRTTAKSVADMMKEKGYSVTLICGSGGKGDGMNHAERELRMKEFRDGVTRILVTTDLLSRGIDVPAVTLVINFDLPQSFVERGQIEYETYLHRVGRTGRFGQNGVAINFIVSEAEKQYITQIEQYFQSKIELLPDDYERIEDMMRNLRLD